MRADALVTRQGWQSLTSLPLIQIVLGKAELSAEAFAMLAAMPTLEQHFLPSSRYATADLAPLATSKNLRHLALSGHPETTDDILDLMIRIRSLTVVDLRGTSVTKAGLQRLAAARPDLMITTDGGIILPGVRPSAPTPAAVPSATPR